MITIFPRIAMKNRKMIEQSSLVGCYSCCKIFDSKDVKEYTDRNETALCPHCNVDCLVGNQCGFVLEESILIKARQYWFNNC